MTDENGELKCDMRRTCTKEVTHIGAKGYAYCGSHARDRRDYERCRPLSGNELAQLKAGTPLASY